MKILVASPRFPSPALPMRGLTSNEQFRLLKAANHEVSAVVPLPWRPAFISQSYWRQYRAVPRIEQDHGVEITHPRYLSLGRAFHFPAAIGIQRRLFWNALRPFVTSFEASGGQIVHAHSCELPGCMLGRLRSAKLVISMHNWELFDIKRPASTWNRMIYNTLRQADAVVYVSCRLKQLALNTVGPHNASVIPYGVDVYNDIQASRAKTFTVSTAARLIDQKHIDILIRAIALIQGEVPDIRLVIIGDGPERAHLENLATQLSVREAIQFTGQIAHRNVVTLMAESHVFVLPSVREALGTVYFEAMSQGVPVVGTVGEGIADFIVDGENGFLVRPDNPTDIVRVLRALHKSSDLALRIAEAGRTSFNQSGFRWEDSVSAHLALFEQVIRKNTSKE